MDVTALTPLAGSRLIGRAAWEGLRRFFGGDDLVRASSIAFFGLLSLFPFLLLALAIVGSISAIDAGRDAVIAVIQGYLPLKFGFIDEQLEALRTARWSLGVSGTVVTAWAALGVFRALTAAINDAWGVREQHGFLRHTLVSFAMLGAAGLLLVAGLGLAGARNLARADWVPAFLAARPALAGVRPALDWLTGVASWWAATGLFVLVVAMVFFFVPATRVRLRDVWAGALLTGLLWHGALAAFSWYLADLGRLSVHGSLAAVVAFLVWTYVQAAILLYGAQFTAAYARLRVATPAARS